MPSPERDSLPNPEEFQVPDTPDEMFPYENSWWDNPELDELMHDMIAGGHMYDAGILLLGKPEPLGIADLPPREVKE